MAAQAESLSVEQLDADYLQRDLVRRARDDASLQPLLPLLGAGSSAAFPPPKPSTDGELPTAIPTRPFAFDAGEEAAGLAPWEVEEILAADGSGGPQEFKNWVACVRFAPSHVLLARSLEGVRRVVRWAARTDRKLRVAGYRHTWSELWTEPGEVILTFVHPDGRETLPYRDAPAGWNSELHGVELVSSVGDGRTPPAGHAFARVMAGTSNNEFREWCFNAGKPQWALPFNVVVAEVTFGGSTSTICHGAGMGTPTLSDLVEEVRYIDARGKDQVVSDPAELRAAAGAFGFLGIVTSVVLRLEPASVAEMRPTQVPLVLCIPPPIGYPLPDIVKRQVEEAGITQKDIDAARKEFVRRAEEDHFHEFFWYPYQKNAWLNTWKRRPLTEHDTDLGRYPEFGVPADELAAMSSYAALSAEIAKKTDLPGPHQTYAFGTASLAGLPNVQPGGSPLTTLTSEALHFRGGSQIFPFNGMEWEVPIPPSPNGEEKRDYTMIQRAWWDAITLLYASPHAPVRAALEMRLTAGSDALLAAQRGNGALGTASLEVFTLLTTPAEEWRAFRQAVVDRWTSYGPGGDSGTALARPHWNKQWADLQVRGRDIRDYLRDEAYKESFAEFREALEGILRRRGSSTREVRERFGNRLMESLIWND